MKIQKSVNESWSFETYTLGNGHKIQLGPGSTIINSLVNGQARIDKMSTINRSTLSGFNGIGCFSYLADTTVGRYSTIASRVSCGAFNHPMNWLSVSEFQYRDVQENIAQPWHLNSEDITRQRTVLGADTWICDNVVIITGCKVGTGAIVGAGAVVTRDVPPYAVVCGNPARIKKFRFSNNLIEELLSSKWWEKDVEELYSYKLSYDNVIDCLKKLNQK